jgi:hypothetical protein
MPSTIAIDPIASDRRVDGLSLRRFNERLTSNASSPANSWNNQLLGSPPRPPRSRFIDSMKSLQSPGMPGRANEPSQSCRCNETTRDSGLTTYPCCSRAWPLRHLRPLTVEERRRTVIRNEELGERSTIGENDRANKSGRHQRQLSARVRSVFDHSRHCTHRLPQVGRGGTTAIPKLCKRSCFWARQRTAFGRDRRRAASCHRDEEKGSQPAVAVADRHDR